MVIMRTIPMESSSFYTRRLPRGCRLCRKGTKMVLLVTGKCAMSCYYCPLSEKKKNRDVVYANERLVEKDEDVLEEAMAIGARGTGITGGDPLAVIDRTVHYIKMLKERFGSQHHIHLYTSTIDRDKFLRLQESGLDELRLHPPVDNWGHLDELGIAESLEGLTIDVGFEVPAIPGEREGLLALCRYASEHDLGFVNLNELEISETNSQALLGRGLTIRSDTSSAIQDSEGLAREVVNTMGADVAIHFCSSSFKDRVQLRERLKRRAKRVARPMDLVTREGMILLGIVEADDPVWAMRLLEKEYEVPLELMFLDEKRKRLEVASWVLEDLASRLPLQCYLVEEYPTADRLEVEREPLN
ncbi:MAG TPA: radical SAM protein [Methanomassiliicoccales archaeon]|nr:radical SAM protein [Methanomassiliicoccales archaeon]